MGLLESFDRSGNLLFRYRGYIPVVLFLIAVPFIALTDISSLPTTTKKIVEILAVLLSFLGLVIRSIAVGTTPRGTSGRNTKKQMAESLNDRGIYSVVRHPLYLGNYFMWIGIVLYTFNWYLVVIVSLLFWLYYERIMFAEENFLRKKFGDPFIRWSNHTPAFLPSLSKYQKGRIPFSIISVMRREYSGVLATVFGFVFVDDLRRFFQTNSFELKTIWHSVFLITLIIVLILRSLKHYTSVLDEEGRS